MEDLALRSNKSPGELNLRIGYLEESEMVPNKQNGISQKLTGNDNKTSYYNIYGQL